VEEYGKCVRTTASKTMTTMTFHRIRNQLVVYHHVPILIARGVDHCNRDDPLKSRNESELPTTIPTRPSCDDDVVVVVVVPVVW
jgi:hypothetical protein